MLGPPRPADVSHRRYACIAQHLGAVAVETLDFDGEGYLGIGDLLLGFMVSGTALFEDDWRRGRGSGVGWGRGAHG